MSTAKIYSILLNTLPWVRLRSYDVRLSLQKGLVPSYLSQFNLHLLREVLSAKSLGHVPEADIDTLWVITQKMKFIHFFHSDNLVACQRHQAIRLLAHPFTALQKKIGISTYSCIELHIGKDNKRTIEEVITYQDPHERILTIHDRIICGISYKDLD